MDDRAATTGPTGSHAEDKWLIARFLAGEAAAFERLFRKYQGPLFAICRRFFGNAADAEDVLQDAFLQIYAGLARFNGRSTFFTWAYSVAVHTCLTKARRVKRAQDTGSLVEKRTPDPLRQQVRDAVLALPDRYRMVVILQYYQGLSQAEIAQVLHWTVGQVKINAHRARHLLREALGREECPATPEGTRECGGGVMKTCTDVRAHFSAYLDGEVSPRQAAWLEAHLRHCPECRAEWARMNDVVAILDTEPREDAEIDLYPAFRQRLAEHASPHWAPRPFPRRLILVAGMVLALLAIGSLLGTHVLHERKLYVSTPRLLHPTLFSSMAIASETIQNQEDADGLLNADPRLTALIDVRAQGETLQEVVTQLSAKTRVPLAVSPELTGQRVFLRLRNITIADALGELRRLASGAWEVTTGKDGKRYTLAAPPQVMKIADAVAQAQAMAAAGEQLCLIHTAITTRDPSLVEEMSIGSTNSLGAELRALQNNPQREVRPDSLALVFFQLNDDAVSTLLAGYKYERTYAELTPEQQHLFRDWVSRGGYFNTKPWDTYSLSMGLAQQDDGTIMLNIGNATTQGNRSSFGFGIFSIFSGPRSSNRLTEKGLEQLLQAARVENDRYVDPALAVKMGNVTYDDTHSLRGRSTYTVQEMLDLIAERTNLQIVADLYSVEERQNRMLPRELTLAELLVVLDRDFNIAWTLDGHNTLRLVHRQWPMLRKTEPDLQVAEGINHHFAERGYLDLDDLCPLMRLSDLKFAGTVEAARPETLIGDLQQLRVTSGVKEALRYYAALPPAQQQAARSARGLSSMTLDAQERYHACQLAHFENHGNTANYTPADLNKPFSFYVIRERASWGELEKRYDRQLIMKDGGILSGGAGGKTAHPCRPSGPFDRNAQYEFLEMRWDGIFDHVLVIQLPMKNDRRS